MCFNKEVSIISYVIGMSSCYLLYARDYKIEALFYAYVIQMQLIEFLLWSNNSCGIVNKSITKVGILLNHLQPFILYVLILKYNKKAPPYIHHLIIIYLITTLLYLSNNYQLVNKCTVGIPNKKELQWSIQYSKSKKFYYLFVFMITILFISCLEKHKYINALLIVISYIISYYKYFDSKGVGTVWCVIAAYIPLLLNIIYTIVEK